MKTTLTLILLSVSSSTVFSMQTDTNDVTFLQDAHNKHQCYNHCTRHNGKSTQWIDQCKADCDEEYDPSPPPNQCYNLGDPCEKDSDCLTGGFNPCTKCGTKHGTQYYKRCYGEPAPSPSPPPPQCYNLGESCERDSDCSTGGFNPCTRCGNTHGTQYYKRCYGEDNEQDNRMLDFIEESHSRRGCMRNKDCGHGKECNDRNICVDKQRNYGCMRNEDCGHGKECSDRNICVDKQRNYGCMRNKDCGHGKECNDRNICVDKQRNYGCRTNLDCGHHMKCKNHRCMRKAAERALRGSNTE